MLKSLLSIAAVGVALPAMAQDHPVSKQTTTPTATHGSHHRHVGKARRQPVKPKTPLTTATGTTTPKPSTPSGVVSPGAPGTQDPTLPGSPPN